MIENIYLSNASVSLTPKSLFAQPFREIGHNFSFISKKISEKSREVFQAAPSMREKVLHFVAAVLLIVPLLNIITWLVLRIFSKNRELEIEKVLSSTQISLVGKVNVGTRIIQGHCKSVIRQEGSDCGAIMAMLYTDAQLAMQQFQPAHTPLLAVARTLTAAQNPDEFKIAKSFWLVLKPKNKSEKKTRQEAACVIKNAEGPKQKEIVEKIFRQDRILELQSLVVDASIQDMPSMCAELKKLHMSPLLFKLPEEKRDEELKKRINTFGPAVIRIPEEEGSFRHLILDTCPKHKLTADSLLTLRDPELGNAIEVKWGSLANILDNSLLQLGKA